jgi:hypothetical protein
LSTTPKSAVRELLEKSRLAGFDEHLTTPVEVDLLLQRLAGLKVRKRPAPAIAATG